MIDAPIEKRHRERAYIAMFGIPEQGTAGWDWICADNGAHFSSARRVAQAMANQEAELIAPPRAGVPGEWLGLPLEHGRTAGPLTLWRYTDPGNWERRNLWEARVRLDTVLNEHDLVKSFPVAVGPADSIDRMTRDWLASLAHLSASHLIGKQVWDVPPPEVSKETIDGWAMALSVGVQDTAELRAFLQEYLSAQASKASAP